MYNAKIIWMLDAGDADRIDEAKFELHNVIHMYRVF